MEKDLINFYINNLNVKSPYGEKMLENIGIIYDKKRIIDELENTEQIYKFYINNKELSENIIDLLSHYKDISKTINKLSKNLILDDIELFEIKQFSLITINLNSKKTMEIESYFPPAIDKVFTILDPEGYGLQNFYIYDIYSEKISKLRTIKKDILKQKPLDEQAMQEIIELIDIEEFEIRKILCKTLKNYVDDLELSITKIGYMDLLFSKAQQIDELNLIKPIVSDDFLEYKKIFNPEVKKELNKQSKDYQKIDVKFFKGVSLITGANMTGKTLLMKTLYLSQILFQMGFFVPALYAKLPIFENITIISGDFQSIKNGLSSYGAEILLVNKIYKKIKNGEKCLVFFDEMARNTNPHEGKAIVKALVELLKNKISFSIISTHYQGVNCFQENIKNYRIKGIKKDEINTKNIKFDNLSEIIDYSIFEMNKEDKIPEEALKIAEFLEVDDDIIKKARDFIESE